MAASKHPAHGKDDDVVEQTEWAWDKEALPEIETTGNAREGEQATQHSMQAKTCWGGEHARWQP